MARCGFAATESIPFHFVVASLIRNDRDTTAFLHSRPSSQEQLVSCSLCWKNR
jgi:hypothetical protein